MKLLSITMIILLTGAAQAQSLRGLAKLPTSGASGLQGSVGTGFADFSVKSPKEDLKMDRGMYVAGSIERGFDVMNLYLTLSLSYMSAEGTSNYKYTILSGTKTYSATDVKFKSEIADLALGIKLKLIDDYWFRPYVEGGGLGGYHQVKYSSLQTALAGQGTDYKSSDVVMGSGYYGEAGIEAMFSDSFGVKLAGRLSNYQTKALETFDNRAMQFSTETYYFSLLFGM